MVSMKRLLSAVLWTSLSVEVLTQCFNYATLPDIEKRRTDVPKDPMDVLCDDKLVEQWYRIDEGLAMEKVDLDFCGTASPIWMNGALPSGISETVDVQMCINIFSPAGCDFPFSISVTNCGAFYVYLLKPATICDTAYCVGSISSSTVHSTSVITTGETSAITTGETSAITTRESTAPAITTPERATSVITTRETATSVITTRETATSAITTPETTQPALTNPEQTSSVITTREAATSALTTRETTPPEITATAMTNPEQTTAQSACTIDGVEYPEGTISPTDNCLRCVPSQSLTDWTELPVELTRGGFTTCSAVCDHVGPNERQILDGLCDLPAVFLTETILGDICYVKDVNVWTQLRCPGLEDILTRMTNVCVHFSTLDIPAAHSASCLN